MNRVKERFFILTPTPTARPIADDSVHEAYLDAEGMQMKSSALFPMQGIGDRIRCTINGIGWARVVGYFESGRWWVRKLEIETILLVMGVLLVAVAVMRFMRPSGTAQTRSSLGIENSSGPSAKN